MIHTEAKRSESESEEDAGHAYSAKKPCFEFLDSRCLDLSDPNVGESGIHILLVNREE